MSNNPFKVGDLIEQTNGPCIGKTFRVSEVDDTRVRVAPDPPIPGFSAVPGWSHHANYKPEHFAAVAAVEAAGDKMVGDKFE